MTRTRLASVAVMALLALGVPAVSLAADATAPGRVSVVVKGTLKNDKGKPLSGVRVELAGQNGAPSATADSDASGYFQFEPLPPGQYRPSMSFQGIPLTPKSTETIEIKADGTIVPDIIDVFGKDTHGKGMWKEILLFVAIAATGGIAVF